MSKWFKVILIALVALIWHGTASAQYYSWGADPTALRWDRIRGNEVSVIYPRTSPALGYSTT